MSSFCLVLSGSQDGSPCVWIAIDHPCPQENPHSPNSVMEATTVHKNQKESVLADKRVGPGMLCSLEDVFKVLSLAWDHGIHGLILLS